MAKVIHGGMIVTEAGMFLRNVRLGRLRIRSDSTAGGARELRIC